VSWMVGGAERRMGSVRRDGGGVLPALPPRRQTPRQGAAEAAVNTIPGEQAEGPVTPLMTILPDYSLETTAFEGLLEGILRGRWEPGDRLREDELGAELGVSRTPLRTALRRLADAGLVVMLPRRGAQVASITAESVAELWEVRRLLEPHALALATAKAPVDDLRGLRGALAAAGVGRVQEAVELERALRQLMVRHCGNQMLGRVLTQAGYRVAHVASVCGAPAVTADSLAEQAEVVEAAAGRRSDAAARALLRHLVNSQDRLVRSLRGKSVWGQSPP
jgi:DNA-binding GntR family transcriptional regulator